MTLTNVPGPQNIYGDLAKNWQWMLALGILMIVLGVIGLGMSYALTVLSVMWFGVLALIGGVAQLIEAFKCSGWKAVAGHVILGVLYVIAGVIMIALPIQSAWWLTLFIGAALIVSGVMRVLMAFQSGAGTGVFMFLVLSGIVSAILGVLIFGLVELPSEETVATADAAQGWFREWGWVIGLFVALELLLQGVTLAALSLAARKVGEMGEGEGGSSPPSA